MKKIGVLTWKFHNYGTSLQAFALNRYLREKGFDCNLVNYTIEYQNLTRVNRFTLRIVIQKLFNRVQRKADQYRLVQSSKEYQEEIALSDRRFEAFYASIPHIGKHPIDKKDLWEAVSDCEALICGSDQIWSPKYMDTSYYLDFVPDGIKKISYAPSVGVSQFTEAEKVLIKPLLQRFDFISVREKHAKKLFDDMGFHQVEHVLDPTMLLPRDIWNRAFPDADHLPEKDYILVYFLSDNAWYQKVVAQVRKAFPELEVVVIPKTVGAFTMDGTKRCDAGPAEFIQLIRNSKYVVTDSYHGMCLSVKFETNFAILQRFDEKQVGSENSRIESLLRILSLEDRLVSWEKENPPMNEVNWEQVERNLIPYIQKSEAYLEKALGDLK